MRVLFLLSIGLDRQATSGHLLIAIIKALCDIGHSVHIIQKDTKGDLPPIPEELKELRVSTDTIPFHSAKKENFIARYFAELKYIFLCRRKIQSGFDAVFIQSTNIGGVAIKAVRRKLPDAILTFNVQDVFPYNLVYCGRIKKKSIVFTFLSAIQRFGYRRCDHIVTISEDMKDLLVEDGVAPEKIDVVYNWSYQDELYQNVDLTPVSYMFNQAYFNVVYAGNIGLLQNVEIIIEAAKLLKAEKSIWFHIIGNGVHKQLLEAKAKEYDISNITFWPMQPSELAPAIYSTADINVVPLVKNAYKTALPSKTATCIACGKPIIFAIGKNSRFGRKIEKESGCVVIESDDAEELSDAIKRIRNHAFPPGSSSFFLREMSISQNSMKYARIITSKE